MNQISQWFSPPPPKRVLLLGLDGAGKTTLLEQIKWLKLGIGLPLSSVTPTIGLNVARPPGLVIWDLSGHSSLRSLWANYLPAAAAVIFVIDSHDAVRAGEALRVLREVLAGAEGKPCLVILNKSDLEFAISFEVPPGVSRVVTLSATCTPQAVDRALNWLISNI